MGKKIKGTIKLETIGYTQVNGEPVRLVRVKKTNEVICLIISKSERILISKNGTQFNVNKN
jgi:hypothetical protein